jgi:hypothetical protein
MGRFDLIEVDAWAGLTVNCVHFYLSFSDEIQSRVTGGRFNTEI